MIVLVFCFILGAVFGSFLNVVILRYNTGMTTRGRSVCFSCQTKLRWYELLPIVSFILLRAKCRTCKSKISFQYPFVEFLTAVIFTITAWKIFFSQWQFLGTHVFSNLRGVELNPHFIIPIVYYWLIFSLLIVIFVYDARHKIIPDVFVYSFNIISGVTLFFDFVDLNFRISAISHFLAGPILFLPFFLLWYFSQGRWVGLGDGKLAWGIGWLLGLSGGVTAFMLSFWIGAGAGLVIFALEYSLKSKISNRYSLFRGLKKLTMKSEIPFAPFLIIGVWSVFVFGNVFERLLFFL